jgi:TonB family protein
MYEDHFGLKGQPFSVTANPKFLFDSDSHREALISLQYGIQERRGFMLLVGEVGTGKSTILRALVEQLETSTRTILIHHTTLNRSELLQMILHELKIQDTGLGRVEMLRALNEFLVGEAQAERPAPVLIIDEAHNLTAELLEEVRLLTNLELGDNKLLQLVLAGQPELDDQLRRPKLRQLRQRIAVWARLKPLSDKEAARYIEHRLKTAGARKRGLFTKDAVQAIWKASGGLPRSINHLCDQSLLNAYAGGHGNVNAASAMEAIRDAGLDNEVAESEGSSEETASVEGAVAEPAPSAGRAASAAAVERSRPARAPERLQTRWSLVVAPAVVIVLIGLLWLIPVRDAAAPLQGTPAGSSPAGTDRSAGGDLGAASIPTGPVDTPDQPTESSPKAAADDAEANVGQKPVATPTETRPETRRTKAAPAAVVNEAGPEARDEPVAAVAAEEVPATSAPSEPVAPTANDSGHPETAADGAAARQQTGAEEVRSAAAESADGAKDGFVAGRDETPEALLVAHAVDEAGARDEPGSAQSEVEPLEAPDDAWDVGPATTTTGGEPVAPATEPPSASADRAAEATFEPPVAIERVPAEYPFAEERLRVSGRVRVRVLVDVDGNVVQAQVEESTNPRLADAAVAAAKQWRFQPATEGGRAVEAWTSALFSFRSR